MKAQNDIQGQSQRNYPRERHSFAVGRALALLAAFQHVWIRYWPFVGWQSGLLAGPVEMAPRNYYKLLHALHFASPRRA